MIAVVIVIQAVFGAIICANTIHTYGLERGLKVMRLEIEKEIAKPDDTFAQ
jgi:hypothetical protein